MTAKSTSKDESLNEFSKSGEQEAEDGEQFIYYACRTCGGRHPQGENPHSGGEE